MRWDTQRLQKGTTQPSRHRSCLGLGLPRMRLKLSRMIFGVVQQQVHSVVSVGTHSGFSSTASLRTVRSACNISKRSACNIMGDQSTPKTRSTFRLLMESHIQALLSRVTLATASCTCAVEAPASLPGCTMNDKGESTGPRGTDNSSLVPL